MNSTAQLARDPQLPLPTGPTHVVSRSSKQPRASNVARARLVVATVTPTGYRVGKFLAGHASYATDTDVRRHVAPGEIFCYWPQSKIAADLGCSERQVRRGIRSLREAGVLEVRRRVRPCEASYVWVQPVLSDVLSGVLSGVRSHTEPRTKPRKNHKRSGGEKSDVRPDQYGRLRNCPKCREFDRGHDDTCQHCDWTREAWEAIKSEPDPPSEKEGAPFPATGLLHPGGGAPTQTGGDL